MNETEKREINITAVIFTGGQVFADSFDELGLTLPADTHIIAADSGYLTARRLGFRPELLLGDLDSLDRTKLLPHELDELDKLIVPAVKDDTDTQLAVETLFERFGTDIDIVIVGGLGGRLDHTLSSVFLLEYIAGKGAATIMTDGRNRVRVMTARGVTQRLQIARGYKYLSLVSLSDVCEGVSVGGVFYPLSVATLTRGWSYAVSNEITADHADISLNSGIMLVIESRD